MPYMPDGKKKKWIPDKPKGKGKNSKPDPFYLSKAWRKLRAQKLRGKPLCECKVCKKFNLRREANVVDHIQPRRYRPDLALDYNNLMSMNERCHNRKSAKELNYQRKRNE